MRGAHPVGSGLAGLNELKEENSRKRWTGMRMMRTLTAGAAVVAMTAAMTACQSAGESDSSSGDTGDTLTIWDYESDDSAMGKAWARAIEIFEEQHPGVTVKTEEQTFEQIQKNAKIVLTGDSVPDVMEYNKGNATAGQLASQGLIADLSDEAASRGWDTKIPESIATTARYTEDGLMGSGSWYGVPNYGEYVLVYYNKDMFADAGVEVPTTMEDLTKAMDAFVEKGQTPLAEAGAEYPMGQLWYDLALAHADDQFIRDYQFFDNKVDWTSGPVVEGAKDLKSFVDAGYIDTNSTGLTAEDMGTAFIAGKYPMMVSGSWWFGRIQTEMTAEWGQFLFPADYTAGSSGNLWVVPENAENKDLAADFIDITLSDEVQEILGENGGLPILGDPSTIADPATREFTENFQTLANGDKLAYYPDWPVAGFYDQVVSNLQSLVSGSKTPEQAMSDLGAVYDEGVADLTGE
jgi:raffinose/stachyose/melibiose transport system substrate-binding protein